jgi:nitrogenase molybdenum-iron protein alpha/beta subunit
VKVSRLALSPRAFLASYSAVCSLNQDEVLVANPQHEPPSRHEQNLLVVDLLDHCDSVTYHHHAVTPFQGALLLAAEVVNDRSIRVSCTARNRQFSQ